MRQGKIIGICIVGALSAAIIAASSLTGCSSSEAVAAKVNGETIAEQTVTDYIQGYRTTNKLTDTDTWREFLNTNNYTPSDLRSDSIEHFIRNILVKQDAAKNNVSVSDADVDDQVNTIKEYYGYTDNAWEEQLATVGYTPESYREYVYQTMLEEALMDAVIDEPTADEASIVALANNYGSSLNGSKEISCIAFDLSSEETASAVATKIKNGELEWDTAKSQYSKTDSMDGWDCLINVDTAISTAIATMSKGEVSDVITTSSYLVIVKVIDELIYPENGFSTRDEIPSALYVEFSSAAASDSKRSLFEEYIAELRESATVEITDMPSGLPYDVDLGTSSNTNTAATENQNSSE